MLSSLIVYQLILHLLATLGLLPADLWPFICLFRAWDHKVAVLARVLDLLAVYTGQNG
jgi:hypothetical protein